VRRRVHSAMRGNAPAMEGQGSIIGRWKAASGDARMRKTPTPPLAVPINHRRASRQSPPRPGPWCFPPRNPDLLDRLRTSLKLPARAV
jgi:hypothetical protein